MTRDHIPQCEFGDIVKLVFLNGQSVFGSFQRIYDQSRGDTLISILHRGATESYGLATLRRVEIL